MDTENLKKLQQIYAHKIEVSEEELIRLLDTHIIEMQATYNKQAKKLEPITAEFIQEFMEKFGQKEDFIKISLIGHNHLGMQCIYFIKKRDFGSKTVMPETYKATKVNGGFYIESL